MASIFADGHKLIDDSDWKNSSAGTNLSIGSQNFDDFLFAGDAVKTDQKYKNGTIVKITSNSINSHVQIDTLPKNTLLSWSIYAKADTSNGTLHTELNGGGGLSNIQLTQNWERYTFNGISDAQGIMYFWKNSGDGNIYLALPKIELGSIATQWSPAPQDLVTQSDLDDLKAEIEQLKSK